MYLYPKARHRVQIMHTPKSQQRNLLMKSWRLCSRRELLYLSVYVDVIMIIFITTMFKPSWCIELTWYCVLSTRLKDCRQISITTLHQVNHHFVNTQHVVTAGPILGYSNTLQYDESSFLYVYIYIYIYYIQCSKGALEYRIRSEMILQKPRMCETVSKVNQSL